MDDVDMQEPRAYSPDRTIQLGRLASDEWGNPDHRPSLILMHGLTFDRHMWRPTIEALQRLDPGRHVLAVDLPGHGESAPSQTPRLGDGGRAIALGLRDRGLGAPVLVGHSAAGVEATFYAAEYPTRGVVNVDALLQADRFVTLLAQLIARYGSDYPAIWREALLPSLRIAQLPGAAQHLLATHSTPTAAVLAAGWDELVEQSPTDLVQQLTAALDRLRETATPYATVFGDHPPTGYLEWLASALPYGRVEVWPGHTHFPHLANPARFARLLAGTADW